MVSYSHVKSHTASQITGTSNKMDDSSVSWGNQKLGKIVRHETTNSKGLEDLKDDFKWCLHVLFNSRKTSRFNTM